MADTRGGDVPTGERVAGGWKRRKKAMVKLPWYLRPESSGGRFKDAQQDRPDEPVFKISHRKTHRSQE